LIFKHQFKQLDPDPKIIFFNRSLLLIMPISEDERRAESVNAIGDKLMKRKQYCEAISYYQESVDLMIKVGNTKRAENFAKELEKAIGSYAVQLNNQGDSYMKQKKYQDAMNIYQQAWDVLIKAGEKWVKKYGDEFSKELCASKCKLATEILKPKADALMQQNEWDNAISRYHDLIEFIPESLDAKTNQILRKGLENVYETLADKINREGDQYYKNKQFPEAIERYAKSVLLIEKTSNEARKKNYKEELSKAFAKHAQEINNYGDKLMKEGKYQEAAMLYDQSVGLAEQSGNRGLIQNFTKEKEAAYAKFAQEINNKADELFKVWKYEEAAQVYKNSIEIAVLAQNQKLIDNFTKEYYQALIKWAETKVKEGNEFNINADFSKALSAYKEAALIVEPIKDKKLLKTFTDTLDRIYLDMAEKVKMNAEMHFKQNNYEVAYEKFDFCVMLGDLAHNERKVKEFRKERDRVMEKWEN
jgi:hypothetical protein